MGIIIENILYIELVCRMDLGYSTINYIIFFLHILFLSSLHKITHQLLLIFLNKNTFEAFVQIS